MEKQRIKDLLIEDDEDDYVLVRKLLSESERARYDMEWFPRTMRLLEAPVRTGQDVCLLDYRLGERTGLELLREAEEQARDARRISLTGHDNAGADVEAIRAGASDYLVKGQITGDLSWSVPSATLSSASASKTGCVNRTSLKPSALLPAVSPMTSITSLRPLLASRMAMVIDADSEVQHKMEQVLKAGLRGRDLVRQILAFSRKSEAERKEINLTHLVNETHALLRSSLPSTIGMHLAMNTSDDHVLADPTQMQQVLMNLATNAADAMPMEGGRAHDRTLISNVPPGQSPSGAGDAAGRLREAGSERHGQGHDG